MKERLVILVSSLVLGSLNTFAADEAADQKAQLLETGKALYNTCAACHGPDGQGIAAGPSKMAPSLTNSPLVTGDPSLLALLILKGITKETQDYLGVMAPLEGAFPTDDKLAAILSYVRQSFGNTASVVSEEEAKAFREEWKDQKGMVTRGHLAELAAAKAK